MEARDVAEKIVDDFITNKLCIKQVKEKDVVDWRWVRIDTIGYHDISLNGLDEMITSTLLLLREKEAYKRGLEEGWNKAMEACEIAASIKELRRP